MTAPFPRVRKAVGRVAFGAVVALSVVVLFAPGSDVPPAPYGVDKLVHAALFAGRPVR